MKTGLIVFVALLGLLASHGQELRADLEDSAPRLHTELVWGGEGVVQYGDSLEFLVVLANAQSTPTAVCWSALPHRDFLTIQVSLNGRPLRLLPIQGEAVPEYILRPSRDLIILPAGAEQLQHLRFDTQRIQSSGECARYTFRARYWCPKAFNDKWEGAAPLQTGKIESTAIDIMIDDRPFWERWFSDTCS